MIPMAMEIFRGGVQTDSGGHTRDWTDTLNDAAASYAPDRHEAPVVLGHPADDSPAHGWIKSLRAENGSLFALGEMTPELKALVDQGLYKKRSAAFYPPDSPHNPTPGKWYLRHVGFLGAMPPAVKGLKPVQFKDKGGEDAVQIDFEDHRSESAVDIGVSNKAHKEGKMRFWKFSDLLDALKGGKVEFGEGDVIVTGEPANPVKPATFTEADLAAGKTAAADAAAKAEREKLSAEFAEQRKKDDAQQARKKRVAEFVEKMRAGKKWLPADDREGISQAIEQLNFSEEIVFGEGPAKKTQADVLLTWLERVLPQRIATGEFSGRDKTVDADLTFEAAIKQKIDSGAVKTRFEAVKKLQAEFSGTHEDWVAWIHGKGA